MYQKLKTFSDKNIHDFSRTFQNHQVRFSKTFSEPGNGNVYKDKQQLLIAVTECDPIHIGLVPH